MAYTPELSSRYSGILRRIAWAYGIPMTQAIEGILEHTCKYMDAKNICETCRDRSFCEDCPFACLVEEKGGET
jgi:hypothetical protein